MSKTSSNIKLVNYSDEISSLEKKANNLKNLQTVSNSIIAWLGKAGIQVPEVRTFVSSVTIDLQKPWITWEEYQSFEQDYKKILIVLHHVNSQMNSIVGEKDTRILFGYEFMEKIGVNFTTEQIQDIAEEKLGTRPNELSVDLTIGKSHRILCPHISRINIEIGGAKFRVGETVFGVKKYENKVKKAKSKNKTSESIYN